MKNKRIIYFDYLRVFAIIAVIFIHVSAQNWQNSDVKGFSWNVFNIFDSAVRWAVPVFVMISGSLFLSKEADIKKIYSKNILRMIIVYFVWSVFYAFAMPFLTGNTQDFSYTTVIEDIIKGSYHMWFIPMIIGLYICIPIIKQIVESKIVAKYFLVISFIFAFIWPQFFDFSNDFIGGRFTAGIYALDNVISNMHMELVLGFSFYFILGYFLANLELNQKHRTVVYVLGIVGFISTVLLTLFSSWKLNEPNIKYYSEFSINVLFEALAVFVCFKYGKFENDKLNSLILKLSKYSFGVYIVHVFIIELLKYFGLNTLSFNPVISVIIISLITTFLSNIISFILNKIPKISKWIV